MSEWLRDEVVQVAGVSAAVVGVLAWVLGADLMYGLLLALGAAWLVILGADTALRDPGGDE